MMSNKMTKTFKVQSDICDEDEVQEITAARNPMKKNEPVCVTCNQTLALENGCKKLIKEEHTELWWHYCGKMFGNRKEVDNHIYEACETISSECTSKDEFENYNE